MLKFNFFNHVNTLCYHWHTTYIRIQEHRQCSTYLMGILQDANMLAKLPHTAERRWWRNWPSGWLEDCYGTETKTLQRRQRMMPARQDNKVTSVATASHKDNKQAGYMPRNLYLQLWSNMPTGSKVSPPQRYFRCSNGAQLWPVDRQALRCLWSPVLPSTTIRLSECKWK